MPRQPRPDFPGAIHHLTAHGVGAEAIFPADPDREAFLSLLGRAVAAHGWRCAGFCLMGTHYHLVIQTAEARLAEGMHWLNGNYARSFNGARGRRGHVFRDRYHTALVTRPEHALEVVRYIALNPVCAGLCASPLDWRWSSYAAVAGHAPLPPWLDVELLFDLVGGVEDRDAGCRRLASFVADSAAFTVPGTVRKT